MEDKGIQTNSIDINTLLSSQTSHAHRAATSRPSHTGQSLTLVGPIRRTQIAWPGAAPPHSSSRRTREAPLGALAPGRERVGGGRPGPAARSEDLAARRSLATRRTLGDENRESKSTRCGLAHNCIRAGQGPSWGRHAPLRTASCPAAAPATRHRPGPRRQGRARDPRSAGCSRRHRPR